MRANARVTRFERDRARSARALLLGLALGLPAPALAQTTPTRREVPPPPAATTTPGPARYDVAPLLDSIRPDERASLAGELGVASLDLLPLYRLHVSIDPEMRGFGLRETITFTNTETRPMRDVALRIFVNATLPRGEAPRVAFLEGRCREGQECSFEQTSPSVILVRPGTPIAPGETRTFELDLQGVMPEIEASRLSMMGQGMEGLAALEGGSTPGDYGLVAHGDGIGSLASFYPVLARRARGRWITDDGGTMGDLSTDTPHHVEARIVVPEGFTVAASGVERGSAPVADPPGHAPRREVTVVAAAVREFAILVGPDLTESRCEAAGVTVRSIHLRRDREAGRHVADVGCAAVGEFTRRFGPYPYPELDIVEAPLVGGAGGVEFSGLVTVARMFYRDALEGGGGMLGALGALAGGDDGAALGELGEMTRSMREFVTAHEVAHQWWHGLVGSDSREHPWIDESLAQYSSIVYVESQHGAQRAQEEGDRQVAMNYRMMRIQGQPDAPVDRPASAFATPIAYAGLVYGKGPYFYAAVRRLVGDAAFFAGLSSYVQDLRFREAGPDDVVDHLARASGGHDAEVRALARHWLVERHGDDDLGPIDANTVARQMMPPGLRAMFDDPTIGPLLEQVAGSMMGGGGLGGLGGGGGGLDAETLEQMQGMLGDSDQLRQMFGPGSPGSAPSPGTAPGGSGPSRSGAAATPAPGSIRHVPGTGSSTDGAQRRVPQRMR